MSHGRAAVVQDDRGGGLQLMSNGDPALILSYCREYWDGASITHLSPADRKEVGYDNILRDHLLLYTLNYGMVFGYIMLYCRCSQCMSDGR